VTLSTPVRILANNASLDILEASKIMRILIFKKLSQFAGLSLSRTA